MYIDKEEDMNIIDNIINIETQKAVTKSMHEMTLCGVELPNSEEMYDFVIGTRESVQNRLEHSN